MLSKWMEEGTNVASRVDEGTANAKHDGNSDARQGWRRVLRMLAEWMKEMRNLSKWMEESTTDASRVDEGNAKAERVDRGKYYGCYQSG
jgi:hypothetical protein